MAIAFVNGNAGYTSSTITSYATGSFSATAGNCIVVYLYTKGTGATAIEDTAGNTYNKLGTYSNGRLIEIWLALNITGHASNIVTATFGSSSGCRIAAAQFSGVALSSAHDTAFNPAGNLDTTNTFTSTSGNTAVDGELIVCAYHTSGAGPFTASSPSVLVVQTGDADDDAIIVNLITTAGAGSVSATLGSADNVYMYSKAIKPAVAAASIVQLLLRQYRARRV